MSELSIDEKYGLKIADFYQGKNVLITGAAGFLGSILLETLLRCCPGIKSIYILLRSKKDIQPENRKTQIFSKKIFEKIKNKTPDVLQKVHVIAGDTSLPKLGMREEDEQLLIEDVSVVFHCAAVINFTKPLEFTLKNNVFSLSSVIGLCRQMRKLEALVYTSTAYSNCNHSNLLVKEEVYRLPFQAEKFLDACKKEDKEKLQELIAYCKPDWPNAYSFSKCLGENVISDNASDLPVVIIRPSIIINTWKHPMPGYIEENSGLVALFLGGAKGFLKAMRGDPNAKIDLVPVDIVANAHIVAAKCIAAKRCASPFVVNCTANDNLQIQLQEYIQAMNKMSFRFPVPNSFEKTPNFRIIQNKYRYYIAAAYHHYLPAIVLDGILRIFGGKPRMYSLYRFFDTVMGSLKYFAFETFEFERNNLQYLDKFIHPDERKDIDLDFRKANLHEMLLAMPETSPFYDWKIDKKSQSEREKTRNKRHLFIKCIQGMSLTTCCIFIYSLLRFIFRWNLLVNSIQGMSLTAHSVFIYWVIRFILRWSQGKSTT